MTLWQICSSEKRKNIVKLLLINPTTTRPSAMGFYLRKELHSVLPLLLLERVLEPIKIEKQFLKMCINKEYGDPYWGSGG